MRLRILVVLFLQTVATAAGAEVPEPLRPWVPWVLEQHADLACPRSGDNVHCVWPGRLRLDLDEEGGSFRLDVEADTEALVELPGDTVHWPSGVTLDGTAALLRSRGGRPAVLVDAGRHEIAGRFGWNRPPQALAVPPAVAVVELLFLGRDVLRPRREDDGRLWLDKSRDEAEEADRLVLAVHRQLSDGVPLALSTRLVFDVTGRARAVELPSPLPDGFVASGLDGELPARWIDGGNLLVQVRAGTWELILRARSRGPVAEIPFAQRPAPWPGEELWAFRADPRLRSVEVEGGRGVDPRRTAVPEAWHTLPTYRLKSGGALRLRELSRGADPPRDTLRVARQIWVADGGRTLAVEDVVEGQVYTAGRLEALAPGELGRGRFSNRVDTYRHAGSDELVEQVLTVSAGDAEAARPGLNVRPGTLHLRTEMRYPSGRALPAVGWSHEAERLKVNLYLPLGWTLLAAWGADRAIGSWPDGFSVLDVLLLLLAVSVTWHRLGRKAGAAVALFFVLAIQEPLGQAAALGWLVVVAAQDGRTRPALRWTAGVGAAVLFAMFAAVQWRTGFHPELQLPMPLKMYDALAEQGLSNPAASHPYGDEVARYENSWTAAVSNTDRAGNYALPRFLKPGELLPPSGPPEAGDPEEVPQTGFGLPSWRGKTCFLYWEGRVAPTRELRLWLLPPVVEGVLSVLRALAALALAVWLYDRRGERPRWTKPRAAASGTAVLAALLLTFPADAQTVAETPTEAPAAAAPAAPEMGLLAQLEERLTRPPACHPSCVEVPWLRLAPEGGELRLSAEVHAAAPAVYRLPGPAPNWTPRRVRLDGADTVALLRDADGFLALRLPAGRHRVEASGPVADAVDLRLPGQPRRVLFDGDGWLFSGAAPGEPPPSAVRLDRLPTADAVAGGERRDEALDPGLVLTRRVEAGLPWQVHSELRRLGATDAVLAVRVPLLAGETVTTPGITIEDGKALVRLEPGEDARAFRSQLQERDELRLRAPRDQPWFERWRLDCSSIWTCRGEGLPAELDPRGFESWRPWPGEELLLTFSRPRPAGGPTFTVDSATFRWEPSVRRSRGWLTLAVRTSVAAERLLVLPPDAEVEGFTIDGGSWPMRFDDGELRFSVPPGKHAVVVKWLEERAAGWWLARPPEVGAEAAANVEVTVRVPAGRRVLAVGGGRGAVVESWAWLALVALGAVVLRRRMPVAVHEWLLLALGVLQLPKISELWGGFWKLDRLWWPPWPVGPLAFAVVAAWLVLAWRGTRPAFVAALAGLAVTCLCATVAVGLLAEPIAHVEPVSLEGLPIYHHGENTLTWYADRAGETLPRPWVLWMPTWAWRCCVLLWAVWLLGRLAAWAPWLRKASAGPGASLEKGPTS